MHDKSMESSYEMSLLKALTKQVESRHFSLLIVDAPNSKIDSVHRLANAAKENQYTVLIIETEEKDPKICHERNVHNRTLEDIEKVLRINCFFDFVTCKLALYHSTQFETRENLHGKPF